MAVLHLHSDFLRSLNQQQLRLALALDLELIDCQPTQLTLIPLSILAADAHALDLLTLPLTRISN